MTTWITDPKQLGDYMRNVRKDKGWSLTTAFQKTGLKEVVVGSWERADRSPSMTNLLGWLDAFGQRLAVLGPEDVVVRSTGDDSEVDWYVVYGQFMHNRIKCETREDAERIWEHMPGSRMAFRTHVYGDLTFEGEQ